MTERTKSIRQARNVYTLKDGTKVPGVTTVLGLRAKPFLIEWAFKLGREHPELNSTRDYTDDLANIGKAAHAMIAGELTGVPPDLSDFTANEIKAAEIPLEKFRAWASGHSITVHASEEVVVNEEDRYGGCLDVLATIDGVLTVIDIKTSKSIYPEFFWQVAAYAEAKKKLGADIKSIRIIRVGRNEGEGFEDQARASWSNEFNAFMALRTLYDIERCIKNNETWAG